MTVKERRRRAGMTLKELSAASGISYSMLSMVERGKRGMSHKTAKKLAPVLGLKQWWRLCEAPEGKEDAG